MLISLGVLHKYVNINLPTNIPDRENESQEGTNRASCRYTPKSKFNVRVHIHKGGRIICRMVQFLFGQRLFDNFQAGEWRTFVIESDATPDLYPDVACNSFASLTEICFSSIGSGFAAVCLAVLSAVRGPLGKVNEYVDQLEVARKKALDLINQKRRSRSDHEAKLEGEVNALKAKEVSATQHLSAADAIPRYLNPLRGKVGLEIIDPGC